MPDLMATSRRLREMGVRCATLIVDEDRARANIAQFVDRAATAGVILRPHFKTHQSAAVAQWFRDAGVARATVSSLGHDRYFADHGWTDLTLAMGANPREVTAYDDLAARIDLALLVDHPHTVAALTAGLSHPVGCWLDCHTGYGRTGIPWQDADRLQSLAGLIDDAPNLNFRGLLTHAGHGYGASDPAAIFATTRDRIRQARDRLGTGHISAGDTPGFAATLDWSGLDEARPGNFVFYDLMQREAQICTADQLACAVACPVIGVYPERQEAVIHAGAVHLSREYLRDGSFGRLLGSGEGGFAGILPGWELRRISQEHGILTAANEQARTELTHLRPGTMVLVAPVHSCLTCEQFDQYQTLGGEVLLRYHRQSS